MNKWLAEKKKTSGKDQEGMSGKMIYEKSIMMMRLIMRIIIMMRMMMMMIMT